MYVFCDSVEVKNYGDDVWCVLWWGLTLPWKWLLGWSMMCFVIASKLKNSKMMYDVFCNKVKVKKITKMIYVFCDNVKVKKKITAEDDVWCVLWWSLTLP